jgi:hypothetical protein
MSNYQILTRLHRGLVGYSAVFCRLSLLLWWVNAQIVP